MNASKNQTDAVTGSKPYLAVVFTATTLMALPQTAAAQIVYSPSAANGVPTLGNLALLALCIGLGALAMLNVKKNNGALSSFMLLCLVGSIASGTAGLRFISEARAGGGAGALTGFIDSPSGGSVPISGGALNIFENTSGVRQRIDDVILPGGCSNPNSGLIDGAPQCRAGGFVATDVNGMCYADCR